MELKETPDDDEVLWEKCMMKESIESAMIQEALSL
jgi:hypothetical protein